MRVVPQSGVGKSTQKRTTINNIEDFDQKKKDQHIFSSHRQIGQQEHIVEINLRGAIKLPKARFPEISARVASVSKQKIQAQKEEPSPLRTKLEIKTNSTYFDEI